MPTKPSFYMPDGVSQEKALARTKHLAIVAHPDDLEFMCMDGILRGCSEKSFGGIVLTSGSGSARTGAFAHVSNAEMATLRYEEQCEAARRGQYSFVWFWQLESSNLKDPQTLAEKVETLKEFLQKLTLERLYAHNPFDRHVSHVAASLLTLQALRLLPKGKLPSKVLGGEGWKNLDWLLPHHKILENVSARQDFQLSLLECFPSQVEGGKAYNQAVMARKKANAVFSNSHAVDEGDLMECHMNLSPLLDTSRSLKVLLDSIVDEHAENLRSEIAPYLLR